jgi:plastocyanin
MKLKIPKSISTTLDRQLPLIIAGVVGLAVLVFMVIQFGPFSNKNDTNSQQGNSQSAADEPAPTPSVTDPSNQTTPTAATTITITADGFAPAAITIARGTILTWTNADSVAHAVDTTASDGGPHSPQLGPKTTFSYSFQTAGTYTYTDPTNPTKTGTVTVTAGD